MMQNTDLVPIEVSLQVQQKTKRKFNIDLKPSDVTIRMLGILFARAVPVIGLAPLGLSFLTIDRKFSFKSFLNLVFVAIGYLLLFDTDLAARYISACVIFEAVLFISERNSKPSLYFVAAASGVILLLCETVLLLWTGFTVADFILALCDTMIMVTGVVVFDKSRNILVGKNFLSSAPLLTDEKISLCIMAGILLLSTKSLTIMDTFNIANCLGGLIIGIAAIQSVGITGSVICGLTVGVLLGINGDFSENIAIFSILGLLCGTLAQFGRTAVCACIGAAGLLLSLYTGLSVGELHLPNLYELLAAAILTYLMPEKITDFVKKLVNFSTETIENTTQYKQHVTQKLNKMSDSFFELSKTFEEISDKPSAIDMSDVSMLFDTAADRVCRNCQKAGYCWQKDFNATYKTMFKFLEIMERKGCLEMADVSQHFGEKCVRLLPLITEINRLFEVYKINRTWKRKIAENRELTGEQFKGIAEIIKNAALELSEEKSPDFISAEKIREALALMELQTEKVDVMRDSSGKYSVDVILKTSAEPSVCEKRIRPTLKKILNVNIVAHSRDFEKLDGNKCRIIFRQAEGFETKIGIAGQAQNEESGDKHFVSYLSGGKFVVTISDGMGTGHKAAMQSDPIVRLLGSFLEAGFDKTIAVKLVNSIMVMKSANDAFATVDMCVIDLYTGEVEFIKNGAEPSYIKHPEFTETVRAASLPIGIVSVVDIETFARTLGNGSMVIMTSDGVKPKNDDDSWLRGLIESIDGEISPQELADVILNRAIKRREEAGLEEDDDMTVVCVKMLDRRHLSAQKQPKKQPKAAML